MIAAVPERRQLTQVLLWECSEAAAQDIDLYVCLCPAVPLRPEQGKPESCVVVGFGSGDSGQRCCVPLMRRGSRTKPKLNAATRSR